MTVTNDFPLSILVGFVMGILGPVLIYEVFIRFNPVGSYWFGRKAETAERNELPVKDEHAVTNPQSAPAMEIKE